MASQTPKRQRLDAEDGRDAQMQDVSTSQPVHELMSMYYQRLFPCAELHRWLSYGHDSKHAQADPELIRKRELCFTLDGDIFVRYQSFKTVEELRRALISKRPSKIDIGPVYNEDPRKRALYKNFHPVSRELVFDIDLTDYDNVRTCGQGAHICSKCWPLMAVAIQVLDRALREDFGFKHVLWVFSGRRGVHAWVCDARARALTDEQRSSVALYLGLYKGIQDGIAKLAVSNVRHPAVARAYESLLEVWTETLLPEQRLLTTPTTLLHVLQVVPDAGVREGLTAKWSKQDGDQAGTDVLRWRELCEALERQAAVLGRTDKVAARKLLKAKEDIVLAYAYPRLDIDVSKKMNHLLKSPFCVHPKTGKVCVPIDPSQAERFDPDAVCTVHSLLGELAAADVSSVSVEAEQWRLTSMAGHMEVFAATFWRGLAAENRDEMASRARETAAAPTLAW